MTQALRQQIDAFFGTGRCFLLAKGRVALYAGLKAMNLPSASKVLMPGYTCMVVPSAVQHAGLEPIYLDINPNTYNLDVDALEHVSTENVSAVIVQHTYGIPCNMAAVQAWASAREIQIIEDCCHTFGSRVDGKLCGTLGQFAFMSGQWNKPFSTGLGGILLVNDLSLADDVSRLLENQAGQIGYLRNLVLATQILAFELFVTPRTAGRITRFYRMLSKFGLAIGSSTGSELRGTIPSEYLSTMAPCQVRKGLRELTRIEENIQHRKQLTAYYHRRLPELGFTPLDAGSAENLPLLRYPVRVANKNEVLRSAEKSGYEIGSWFEVPLHPAGTDMESLAYHAGMCPEGERAGRQVVNLPTHLKVDEAKAEKTLEFLGRCAEPL